MDAKRRGRPRSREEAKARARAGRKQAPRGDRPPTWRNAFIRGLVAAVVFGAFMLLLGRSVGSSAGLAAFMLAFYVPAGYYVDSMLWRRRERARIRAEKK